MQDMALAFPALEMCLILTTVLSDYAELIAYPWNGRKSSEGGAEILETSLRIPAGKRASLHKLSQHYNSDKPKDFQSEIVLSFVYDRL